MYRAEGSLFLQGKHVHCSVLTIWPHLCLHVCLWGMLQCDWGGCVPLLCYGWDRHDTWCVVPGDTQWRRFVLFKTRLAVGLWVCMMVGKSVMHGIVIIGVSSITLCSSSCTCSCDASATLCLASTTLCSSRMGVGFNKRSFLCPRYLTNCLFLVVWLASIVAWVSLSVSAQRYWCGVKLGSWQCCGNSSVSLETW